MNSNFTDTNTTFPNGTGGPEVYLGPEIPIPINYACGGVTLFVLVINLFASLALCIARRSCMLVAIPCLKSDDPRRRAWLQHVVITALLLYCLTNLISASFGTGSYTAILNFQMELFTVLNSIDSGFLFISAANSFVIVGMMILLWLNIAVVWFELNEYRTKWSQFGFIAVVASLLMFIAIGVLNSLIASLLAFLSGYIPTLSLQDPKNTALSNAQFYITFAVSVILLIYGLGIGIRIIVILKQGIKKEDQSFMIARRNVMMLKVLLVLAGAAISLAIRFAGTLVLLSYFNLYAVLLLVMRAFPDAAITWSFTVLFWPYKSPKVVTIDAPEKKELITKAPGKKMQEMKSMSVSSSPATVSEVPSQSSETPTAAETPLQTVALDA